MEEQWVVVFGNYDVGYDVIGPFAAKADALKYGRTDPMYKQFKVVELYAPAAPEEC